MRIFHVKNALFLDLENARLVPNALFRTIWTKASRVFLGARAPKTRRIFYPRLADFTNAIARQLRCARTMSARESRKRGRAVNYTEDTDVAPVRTLHLREGMLCCRTSAIAYA